MRDILIVGGGATGWLAACFLQKTLETWQPGVYRITLVESEDIGILGVGEATVPTLLHTLQYLGISELEFIQQTAATFKHAIRFDNWLYDPAQQSSQYFHPFSRPNTLGGIEPIHLWHALNGKEKFGPYAEAVVIPPSLCHANKSPKLFNSKPFEAPTGYAYHMDAVLFARLLRKVALERGVNHVVGTIKQVNQTTDGSIQSVVTESGNELTAELFLDCTGFYGLLIDKTLKADYRSYKNHLLCDHAVTMQIPSDVKAPIKPYTISTAAKHGWIWEIPVQGRKGIGYVYSSQFVSHADAEIELRNYVGSAGAETPARKIVMKTGRHEQMWSKNVVALGLAAGFIEPLESSGIYLTEMALRLLADYFPHGGENPVLRNRFNRYITKLYDEIMEFIVMHYHLTQREDTEFWKTNKFLKDIPAQLAEELETWRYRKPTPFDKGNLLQFFNHETHQYIMAGMNFLPESSNHLKNQQILKQAEEYSARIKATAQQAIKASPEHGDYLRRVMLHK